MENNNLIHLENIERTYKVGETQVRALKGISHEIRKGDLLAIMGPSGSGKSTLMNIIGCLDRPTAGKYFLEGQEVSKMNKNQLASIRNKKSGFVFQNFNLLARTTALENTELPLLYSDVSSKKSRELAMRSLAQVGLEGRELHKTNQLSGGEMQRVAIARALANNPKFLLMDEPTGNIDSKTADEIIDLVRELNEDKGVTTIVVTHDQRVASQTKRSVQMLDGLIVEERMN